MVFNWYLQVRGIPNIYLDLYYRFKASHPYKYKRSILVQQSELPMVNPALVRRKRVGEVSSARKSVVFSLQQIETYYGVKGNTA